ncbi:MAG TPA: Dabb family protein [Prolixibacteraceae bacterium]|nr:Dabb family protein [Prolixibacteraceae bacterium]
MINHIVLFKLKKYDSEREKQAVISEIEEALLSLSGKIEELIHIEVGVNYDLNAQSHDICLISHFDSLDALEAYRVHPEHVKVARFIGPHAVERAAVDFEF